MGCVAVSSKYCVSFISLKENESTLLAIEQPDNKVKYAIKGTVIDNLVLIGSPISMEFLQRLRNIVQIKKLIIIDLNEYEDPIFAGMSVFELFSNLPTLAGQMPNSEGHFYYAEPTNIGDKRRNTLANELYALCLR